jgi:23S rRNA pseudouridine1911/1915/1917 synthase
MLTCTMPQTLLDRLMSLRPAAKRDALRQLVESGRVTINHKPSRNLRQPVTDADHVAVTRDVTPPGLDVVYEDADVLVANKPVGLLTSTVPHEPRPTLAALVREHAKSRDPKSVVGVIHRLDRDVSGLLVFSKSPRAYDSLKDQLKKRTMKRVYAAVVAGVPARPSGKYDSRLVEYKNGRVHATRNPAAGERAITEYQLLSSTATRSLLRISLLTGRKHQIRVHLADNGLPVLGDPLYAKSHPAPRLMLAAIHLSFAHPGTGKPMKFELPLPKEFKTALNG